MDDVRDRVAFVTGGASGIGLGIAKALLGAGAKVVIADLRPDHLDEAKAALAAYDNRLLGIELDVTDRDAMADAADRVEQAFGRIDILVNNAGVGIEGPLGEASYADWDFGLAVNLGGVVNGLQTFVPRIRAGGSGGHVVNTASLAGLVQMPSFMAIYATAKAAVIALTESIRDDLARDGIGASVLCPGPIKSRIHELERNRPERFQASQGFSAAAERLGKRRGVALVDGARGGRRHGARRDPRQPALRHHPRRMARRGPGPSRRDHGRDADGGEPRADRVAAAEGVT